MTQIKLERTGDRPITFEGKAIAEGSSRMTRGNESTRWHEITVYQGGDKFVTHIEYKTLWQGEIDHSAVFIGDPATSVLDYDPCCFLIGYPSGKQFEEKQARLKQDLIRRYQALVSEVLQGFPESL